MGGPQARVNGNNFQLSLVQMAEKNLRVLLRWIENPRMYASLAGKLESNLILEMQRLGNIPIEGEAAVGRPTA